MATRKTGDCRIHLREFLMPQNILAVYGSPRRHGNTATLLDAAVEGARDAGARVETIVLRDLKISPCLEIYGCKKNGECAIRDDFQGIRDKFLSAQGVMLASPIFFYAVSSHTKALMERFQSLWVKKHWVDNVPLGTPTYTRKGLFITVGATRGKKVFDGAILSVKYFFDVLDISLLKTLSYRGIDFEGDIEEHPEHIREAYDAGKELADALQSD
jgi:multimeric flavodoxin WrbA